MFVVCVAGKSQKGSHLSDSLCPATSPNHHARLNLFLHGRSEHTVRRQMKAAILFSPSDVSKRPLRVREVSRPYLKPCHVLLRVRACGVCRTDLHIVEGELPPLCDQVIPGHQIVGEIADSGTTDLTTGTRVGVSWIGGVDGSCWYCQRGLENLCDSPTLTGYSVNGGYAEYALVLADLHFRWRTCLTTCKLLPFCAPALSDFAAFA
jgi:propanol-preferring alcohol dehydrogenase